ncbi:chaperone protein ClpC2, chloroplastic-like [Pistacia vera]|uniref:chaperone protein ClpC2, chloroplastic-like n=1 Tax=Pistacia vera TaxID=55513 RepID=UPI001262C729|nr:chaperone protein ClpC2, chloroplastic-like [Pistacia vera]
MEKLEKQGPVQLEMLNKYATDLTQMAKEGKLDPLIGRQRELERVIQILCKRRKNNPCLIGDPGVGKTVIVEGLAQRITNNTSPVKLQRKKIYALDMGRLIAGASNRGEYEERLTKLIDEVKLSEGSIILFIDEVHTLIGAGSGGQAVAAADIMKPALARGELRCIGATTFDEYKKYIEKDAALKRRFQQVLVPEPSVAETIEILLGLCSKYESHHNVKYTANSLAAAAQLSHQYISDRFNPDKSIDLIDEAGAKLVIHQTKGSPGTKMLITEDNIKEMVSTWTGIPMEKISSEESHQLLQMERTLQKHIIGQAEAVAAVSRAIRRARVGIRDPSRPISSFLFTGPTGVGKTELAKALAIEYFGSKDAMIRIDMSEYMERHTVSKFFGSPPGYVGSENGGQLTEAVRHRPHSLILFDEIEKAHCDVLNIMLQVLDCGRLTDNKGQTVDFKNTIIIMTSNIGGNFIFKKSHLGFDHVEMKVAEELKKNFRPEFLNRIDEVIVFRPLSNSQLKEIVEIMLKQVYERLKEKNIKVEVTERFKEEILKEGYNPSYGARPLRRAIGRLLEDNLAERILNGSIKQGDSVTVNVDSNGKILAYYLFNAVP